MITTVLFDLDGTLADTAPDLAAALNRLLIEQERPPLAYEVIRPHVSHGAQALVQLGFPQTVGAPEFEPLRLRLIDHYRAAIANETRLFDGMAALLDSIEGRGMNWGVVTNKPGFLTEPLLAALGLSRRAATIVSGDTLAERKPHPAPLLLASREAGSEPVECLYVGDAERDIEAGRRAGMRTLIALFGYIGEEDRPETWQADGMVDHPTAILDYL